MMFGFKRLSLLVVVAFALLATGSVGVRDAHGASEPTTVSGEYVVYEVGQGQLVTIGPSELNTLFHRGGVGGGIACTVERTEVIDNAVSFTFNDDGTVTGTGRLELSCEYHPGCGAVSRIIEVLYSAGRYDESKRWFSGDVVWGWPDSEATSYGTGQDDSWMCLSRWVVPAEKFTAKWVLAVTETGRGTLAGYHVPESVLGGDPAWRRGLFDIPAPAGLAIGDADIGSSEAEAPDTGGAAIPEDVAEAERSEVDDFEDEAATPSGDDADGESAAEDVDGAVDLSEGGAPPATQPDSGSGLSSLSLIVLLLGLVLGAAGAVIAVKTVMLLRGDKAQSKVVLTQPIEAGLSHKSAVEAIADATEKTWNKAPDERSDPNDPARTPAPPMSFGKEMVTTFDLITEELEEVGTNWQSHYSETASTVGILTPDQTYSGALPTVFTIEPGVRYQTRPGKPGRPNIRILDDSGRVIVEGFETFRTF